MLSVDTQLDVTVEKVYSLLFYFSQIFGTDMFLWLGCSSDTVSLTS